MDQFCKNGQFNQFLIYAGHALINIYQTGGFIISYFQVTWAQAQGTKVSFGIQAAICVGAFLIIIALLFFGKKLRLRSGGLGFATA